MVVNPKISLFLITLKSGHHIQTVILTDVILRFFGTPPLSLTNRPIRRSFVGLQSVIVIASF